MQANGALPEEENFRQLQSRKDQVLDAHHARSSKAAEIRELISSYKDAAIRSPQLAAQAKLALADLHTALNEEEPALSALAEIAGKESNKAVAKAAEIMLRMNSRRRNSRKVVQPTAENIRKIAGQISLAARPGFQRNRLDMFLAAFNRDYQLTLNKCEQNLRLKPAQTIIDLRRILAGKFPRQHPDLGKLISKCSREMEAGKGVDIIQTYRVLVHANAGRWKAFWSARKVKASVAGFLASASADEIMCFSMALKPMRHVGGFVQSVKIATLEELKRRLSSGSFSEPKQMIGYLAEAGNTLRFWQDAGWREDVLSSAERLAANRSDPQSRFVLGTVAFLRCDFKTAQSHFSAATEGEITVSTGAANYFLNLQPDDFARTLLANDSVILPDEPRSPAAIVACADSGYFNKFAKRYLNSFRDVGGQSRVHFHIAGTRAEVSETIADLQRSGSGHVSFSFENPPSASPAYYASMRFLRGPLFLERIAGRILLTDIDAVFIRNPDSDLRKMEEQKADVALRLIDSIRVVRDSGPNGKEFYRYPQLHPWHLAMAGYIYISGSPLGMTAANIIAEDLACHLSKAFSSGKQVWWIDQNSLFYSYRRLKTIDGLRLVNVEDIGTPFGFDYSQLRNLGGVTPVMKC